MRTLVAKFHPARRSSSAAVTVGRVICDGKHAFLEPTEINSRAIQPFDPVRLAEKLQFLVASTAVDAYRELLQLRSEFWSFEETAANDGDA